jgi:flagellar assembly protein FliH
VSARRSRAEVISDFAGQAWQLPAVEGELVLDDGARRRISLPTAQDLEALAKAAHEEGFKQGYEDGRRAGHAAGTQQLAEACRHVESIIERLADPLRDLDDAVVKSIADLAILIARQLVRRELRVAPGEVVAVVRQALACLPAAARHPRVRLHPEDLELVAAAMGPAEADRTWRLEPDPLITRGGCLVETEASYIDATIEARIAAVASRMLGGDREEDRGS